ncbi:MAG: hypothetical protein AB7I27_03435 [Bacteriovoracaceae bacterium]
MPIAENGCFALQMEDSFRRRKQFEENWAIVTKAIKKECGSYGSRLHNVQNGEVCKNRRILLSSYRPRADSTDVFTQSIGLL